MADIHRIIEAVAAGVAPRLAVGQELDTLPHGWRDSDASGSRIKILYNPTHPSKYKGHVVKMDSHTGQWTYHERGALTGHGRSHPELIQHLHKTHDRFLEAVDEVAPPGFSGTVKAMKKHHDIDNPFALAWSMKNKGAKPHIKPEKSEALDKDSASALRPRGLKPSGPPPRVHPPEIREPKKAPIDPTLKKRAMDWNKYQSTHPDETPEQKKALIHATMTAHGFRQAPQSAGPGVTSYQHPDHPTHVIHYLAGPNRPEGSPDGAWYHHDNAMVAHNSGYDHESLDTHLGQFFGTGGEHPQQ